MWTCCTYSRNEELLHMYIYSIAVILYYGYNHLIQYDPTEYKGTYCRVILYHTAKAAFIYVLHTEPYAYVDAHRHRCVLAEPKGHLYRNANLVLSLHKPCTNHAQTLDFIYNSNYIKCSPLISTQTHSQCS